MARRVDHSALPGSVHDQLRAADATLATAESLTGGRLGAWLTSVPGASATYRGGVIAYATELKIALLGVPVEIVERHGVVSAECARAMSLGVRSATGATYAISTTGVAGPDRQDDKPAGTVFVAVCGPAGVRVSALELSGSRDEIVERTCVEALMELSAALAAADPTGG